MGGVERGVRNAKKQEDRRRSDATRVAGTGGESGGLTTNTPYGKINRHR